MNPMLIMGIASLFSAYQSSKAAGQAGDLTAESLQMTREQYERFKKYYGPIEAQLSRELQGPLEDQPGFSRMLSEIDRGYGDMSAQVRRTMSGRYPAGSGLEYAAQTGLEIGRSQSRAKGIQEAGEAKFQRMQQFLNAGRGIPGQATSQITNIAGQATDQANAAAGATGDALSNLLTLWYLGGSAKNPASQTGNSQTGNQNFGWS